MISSSPLLSVVIPFHDRVSFLHDTLRSLSDQQDVPIPVSLILVDNSRSVESSHVVNQWIRTECKSWMKLQIVTENEEHGASSARNKGLSVCKTPWVIFFDSDDIMPPHHLRDIIDAITSNPSKDVIYWRSVLAYPDGCRKIRRPVSSDASKDIVLRSLWATQRYAVKTEFIRNCGGWNILLPVWNDWELSVRMLVNKPDTLYMPDINPVKVNIHKDSLTGYRLIDKCGEWEKSLESAREYAESNNANKIVRLIDCKKILLASRYRGEKEKEKSKRLLQELKEESDLSNFKRKLIYYVDLYLSHGASTIASWLC